MMKKKKNKRRNFYEILLTHISGTACGILLKFETWPPLHGGQFLCKFGATWISHHRATDAWKPKFCCSFQYTHSVLRAPHFLGPHDCLDITTVKSNLVPILQHCDKDRWNKYSNKAFLLWHNKVMHYAWSSHTWISILTAYNWWICMIVHVCTYVDTLIITGWCGFLWLFFAGCIFVKRDALCLDSHAHTVA